METRYEDIAAEQKLENSYRCFIQRMDKSRLIASSHMHNYIELIFILKGTVRIFLDGKLFNVKKDDLIIINSREAHYIESDDYETEYIVIQFDPKMLQMSSTVFTLKYILPFSGADKKYPRLFNDETKIQDIKSRVTKIYEEDKERKYAYELAVQGNIIMLFLDIVRAWHDYGIDIKSDIVIKEKDVEWLNKATSFIAENYNQDISARDVSKVCLMSYNYFTTRFKQLLGRSYSSYLSTVRLQHAEHILISTDKSITEIAYDCGFSSTSYFISMFSQYKKMTPQSYRKYILNKV